jgi:hypothetical protein
MFEKKKNINLKPRFWIFFNSKPYLEVLSNNNNNNKRETDIGGFPKKKKQKITQPNTGPNSQLPSCCVCKRVEKFHIILTPKFNDNLAGEGGGARACQGLWCVTDVDTACGRWCDTCVCARFFPTLVLHSSSSSSSSSICVYLKQYHSFWQRQESALWFNTLYLTAPRHHYS